jgi:hypothetical protein
MQVVTSPVNLPSFFLYVCPFFKESQVSAPYEAVLQTSI